MRGEALPILYFRETKIEQGVVLCKNFVMQKQDFWNTLPIALHS